MTDPDIPLDITGHEDRERPGGSTPGSGEGGVTDPGTNGSCNPSRSSDRPPATRANDGSGEEVEPVEVLVQLAEDGEIEPWDIDIVAVTDKFLDRLDVADLRSSGRALFYASVLCRMKADAMLSADDDETEDPEPWESALNADAPTGEQNPFAPLEQEIERRLERKRARGMPQTLDELVRDLRSAERDNWWKESREYDTSDEPSAYSRGTQELDYRSSDQFRMDDEPTEAEVTGDTHGEDIDEIVDDVYATVREHYDQGRKEVLFREIEDAGGSRVSTFLGLLFLSHRGRVRLRQDELFGDLWVQDPNASTGSGEVVAD
jgi:segregation and condensation protein A